MKENPTEATYQLYEESGTDLGQARAPALALGFASDPPFRGLVADTSQPKPTQANPVPGRQALAGKATLTQMKSAMPPAMAKALGRISGGLYLVTAARGNAKSAMIASWVAQARTALSADSPSSAEALPVVKRLRCPPATVRSGVLQAAGLHRRGCSGPRHREPHAGWRPLCAQLPA